MPKLGEWLGGKSSKTSKLPTMSPEQQQLFSQLIQALGGGGGMEGRLGMLMKYLDPNSDVYENFEQPYMDEFNEEIIPGIAERFAGKGALSSSGFGQSLSAASGRLQHQLAAMKSGMQRDAVKDYMGLYQGALNVQPFGYQHKPGNSGLIGGAAQGFASGFGGSYGSAMGSRF